MAQKFEDEELMRAYLLGMLAEDQQTRLEERLMTDDEYFERLSAVEDELTDDYARGLLKNSEKRNFELRFMAAPERRQKAKIAMALNKYIAQAAPVKSATIDARPSWLESVFAFFSLERIAIPALAAALIMAAGFLWQYAENADLKRRLEQARNEAPASNHDLRSENERLARTLEEERSRNQDLAKSLEQERARSAEIENELAELKGRKPSLTENVLSFALMPGLLRDSDGLTKVELTNNTDRLRFDLALESDDYESYRAELRNDEGKTLKTSDNLKAIGNKTNRKAAFNLSASLLKNGDYRIVLSGKSGGDYEKVGTYYFRVARK